MIFLFELPIGTPFRRLFVLGALQYGLAYIAACWHDYGTGEHQT